MLYHDLEDLNYKRELCAQVFHIAEQAGARIREALQERSALQVESKGVHDYVTNVDKELDAFLVNELGKLNPEIRTLSEEGGCVESAGRSGYYWVIDPIDGTTNFVHGAGPVAVSIGLMYETEAGREFFLGVIHEATHSETFSAVRGGGAFCDGRRIGVSGCSSLGDALIATGFPYSQFHYKLPALFNTFEYMVRTTAGVRRLGSAATDLAYVAAGRFDGFYEFGLHDWDVAAGIVIAREAGALLSDFDGGGKYVYSQEIVCASPRIFKEFQQEIGTRMHACSSVEDKAR